MYWDQSARLCMFKFSKNATCTSTRAKARQRPGTQRWVKPQNRHHKSSETANEAMQIWLALEVTLNGTSLHHTASRTNRFQEMAAYFAGTTTAGSPLPTSTGKPSLTPSPSLLISLPEPTSVTNGVLGCHRVAALHLAL